MAQICNLHHLLCTSCGWRRRVADFADVAVVPRCAACGSIERPNVVLFGEMLPTGELARLESALAVGFDVVFSIGTSSLFPYISEPVRLAKTLGATTVEINPDETDISKVVDIRIRARAAAALESLATWRAVRQGPAVLPCWPWPKGCCSSPSPPAKPDFRNTEGSTMSTLYDSSISVLRRLCAAIAAGSAYVYRSLKLPDFLDSTEVTEADAWYDRFKFDPDADYSHFLDHARHRFSISETSNRILDTKAQWVLAARGSKAFYRR